MVLISRNYLACTIIVFVSIGSLQEAYIQKNKRIQQENKRIQQESNLYVRRTKTIT